MFIHLPKFLISAIQAWDSLADLVFWNVEVIGLRVTPSVISIIGYFCISSVNLCYYYRPA